MFGIPQIIGYIAMAIVLITFQFKTQKTIIILQFFSTLLFSIHFFMLGAYSGALLNALCMVRAFVYANLSGWGGHKAWMYFFIFMTFVCYALTVSLFIPDPTPAQFALEILPVIGNVITCIGMRKEKAADVRRYTLCSSPLWFSYNVISGSIGGALTEAIASLSIITAMIRLDRKKKAEK